MLLYQILVHAIHGKMWKSHTKIINLKNLANVKWKISITWWIIFCISYLRLFWVYHQKPWTVTVNSPIRAYIETGYYLQHLMPETMKLLGNAKSKITKEKNGEIVPHLSITEVVLIYCIIVN